MSIKYYGRSGCYLVAAKKHISLYDYIQRKEEKRLPREVLYKEKGDVDLHISGKVMEDRVFEDGGWEKRSLWKVKIVNT